MPCDAGTVKRPSSGPAPHLDLGRTPLTPPADGYSCWPGVTKAWGHATSRDLFAWTDHAIAIHDTPSEGSIFSGSVVVDLAAADNATAPAPVLAFFTSHKPAEEAQYLAFSLDGGYTFAPYVANPLISLRRGDFRDPKVEWHAPSRRWVMVVTLIDSVVFYGSEDLRAWTRLSVFKPDVYIGGIECPALLRVARRKGRGGARATADDELVGEAYVLVLSLGNGGPGFRRSAVKYIVGSFDGTRFTPDAAPRGLPSSGPGPATAPAQTYRDLDFGPDAYAAAFFHLPYPAAGLPAYSPAPANLVSMAWASSLVYAGDTPTATPEGWRHCMTAAREHWLDAATNRLASAPVPPDPARFAAEVRRADLTPGPEPLVLHSAVGNPARSFRLRIRAPRNASAAVELAFAAPGPAPREAVVVELALRGDGTARLRLARQGMRAWRAPDWMRDFGPETDVESVAAAGGGDDDIREFVVDGVVDRSIAEVYADGGLAAGTMLFFAEGVLSETALRSAGPVGPVRVDYEERELVSVWASGGEGRDGAGEDEMGEL